MLEHPSMVDTILTTLEGTVVGSDSGAQQKISKRSAGNGSRWSCTRGGAADGGGQTLMTRVCLDNQKQWWEEQEERGK